MHVYTLRKKHKAKKQRESKCAYNTDSYNIDILKPIKNVLKLHSGFH